MAPGNNNNNTKKGGATGGSKKTSAAAKNTTTTTTTKTTNNLKQGSLFSFFKKKTPEPSSSSSSSALAKKSPTASAVDGSSTKNSGSNSSSTTSSSTSTKANKPNTGTPTTAAAARPAAAAATSPPNKNKPKTATTSSTTIHKNSLWKKVHVGDRIRIYWPDDRQYYAAQVMKAKNIVTGSGGGSGGGGGGNHNSANSTFFLRYDDGESEWTDLSTEKFQFLSKQESEDHSGKSTSSQPNNNKRRHIANDDDEGEDEHEWQDDNSDDDDDDEDDGSVFEAKPDDEEEDDEDQWMVTDEEEEDDDEEVMGPSTFKKRKTSSSTSTTTTTTTTTTTSSKKKKKPSLQVTHHKAASATVPRRAASAVSATSGSSKGSGTTAPAPPPSAAVYKTPLREFANTVSPSTASSRKSSMSAISSNHNHSKEAPSSPALLPRASHVTTSPAAAAAAAPRAASTTTSTTKTTNHHHNNNAPPMYVKGAVNSKGSHVHNHLAFLQPSSLRDLQGKRPDEPGYNPRTLKVVARDWKEHVGEMTNAVQQWWDLKSQYFDSVLLFKTGKFYEMFHMDADIGVEVLNLSYMKGHIAHAGFPEISYGPMADKLVQAGYKVARVEQTETPDQLKIRKANTPRGQKKPAVVNREVCSIVSLGTRTFCALDDEKVLEQLDHTNSTSTSGGPLLAISEVLVEPSSSSTTSSSSSQEENGDGDEEEEENQVQPVCEYGITLVDAVRGTVTVGQFADDILRSRMNTLLARFTPSEILLSDTASPVLRGLIQSYTTTTTASCRMETVHTQEPAPQSTALNPHHRRQLERTKSVVQPWNVEETLEELHRKGYYPRGSKQATSGDSSIRRWPAVLQALVQGEATLALASFGASLYYLQRHLIDHEILSMGVVKAYIPEASSSLAASSTTSTTNPLVDDTADSMDEDPTTSPTGLASISAPISAEDQITFLSLDGTTLHNLEILTNAVDHKVAGSLWSKINYCKSPHGARFLRAWLLRPLFRKTDIDRRADAVQELAAGAGAVALNEVRQHVLGKVGDLDRLLSRIHSMSGTTGTESSEVGGGSYHPSDRAVLYENATYTKRKVNDFSKVLNGLRKACQIPELFADLQLDPNGLLFKLVRLQGESEGGCFPSMVEDLDFFFDNFDCNKAAKGLFEPSRGVDEAYDQACDTIGRIQADLEDYKQEMCQVLSPRHVARRDWTYVNTKPDSKDKYLIELPATVEVPDDFLIKGKRGSGAKQVNKYRTPVVARLVQELEHAFDIQQERKAMGMQLIFAKFDSKRSLWRAAAQATAMLDALGSLAKVASKPGFCRPTILDCPLDQPPTIDIVQGRHPCVEGSSIHTTEFIPNDLRLGGSPEASHQDKARLLLLSGPNMGGKSTLLRQTCLIAILAQMGSYVPAESCSLTPIDCIYTRLGASDRILLGQSTFFVELAETAAALRGATRRSLVIMDELGRGTSTFDGTAIAGATVKHLIERSQCLSLFATHYHSLLDEWKNESMVRLGHMQCMVEEETSSSSTTSAITQQENNSDQHSITFLYTLGPGTCPKSFGINVARLASLPPEVLANAKRVSEEFEEEMAEAHDHSHSDKNHNNAKNATTQKEQILAAIHSGNWEELERLWNEVQK